MNDIRKYITLLETAEVYTLEEFNTYTLSENNEFGWADRKSTAFKKGFKKYRNDARVMQAYDQLRDFIESHNGIPKIDEYPIEFNVHPLTKPPHAGYMSAHLKGQKIVLIFKVDSSPNVIDLRHIGTHQAGGMC